MSRRRNHDGGFTLAEMLVVIVLFGLVGGAIATVVVTTLRHQADIQNRASALNDARSALERIDRDVRSATRVGGGSAILTPSATGNQLQLTEYPYDSLGGSSGIYRVVTYSLSGTNLTYRATDYNALDVAVANRGPTIVARYVVKTTVEPLFTYHAATESVTTTINLQPPILNTPVRISDADSTSDPGTAVRNPTPAPTT